MTEAAGFDNPPIVELALGVQFSRLTKLTAGHFGLFWKELGDDWTKAGDGPPIEERFELFDRPKRSTPLGPQLKLEPYPWPGRFTLWHRNLDRLLQVQATRLHLNWRKRDGVYPRYQQIISEFLAMFDRFRAFTQAMAVGDVRPNQWELTYIDAFAKRDYWNTPADWGSVLPGLFGPIFPFADVGLAIEHRATEASFELEPRRGRLHVAAGLGRVEGDPEEALLLRMTARGPLGKGGASSVREGLDLGHEKAVQAFLRVTSDDAKLKWAAKP